MHYRIFAFPETFVASSHKLIYTSFCLLPQSFFFFHSRLLLSHFMYHTVFKCLNCGETPAAKGVVGQTNWLPCASGIPYRAGHAPACWVKTPWERLNCLRQEPTSYFQKCFLHVVNQVSLQITSRQTKSLGFSWRYPEGSPRTHVNAVPPTACSLQRQY